MVPVTNLQWNDEFATRAALAWGRLAGQPTDTVEVGGEIEYCEEILSAFQLTVIFAVGNKRDIPSAPLTPLAELAHF